MTMLLLAGCTFVIADVPCDEPTSEDTDTPADTDTGTPADTDTGTPVDTGTRDADGDGYDTAEDCDDTDPDVFPGAPERCNGVSDACDPVWESDAGIVTWAIGDDDVDLSSEFAAGVDGAPATITLEGGTLDVCAGTWFVNLVTSGSLTARGEGVGVSVLDGGGAGTVVKLGAGEHRLEGLTIQGGFSAEGGGVFLAEADSATLDGCAISDNAARKGAGVYMNATTQALTVTGSLVTANIASQQGGGLYLRGTVTMEGVDVSANEAVQGGGLAMSDGAEVAISDSSVTDNAASEVGGAVISNAGTMSTLDLDHVAVTGNTADVHTGGVWGVDLALSCTGEAGVGGYGVYANHSLDAKGPQITIGGTSASADGTDCDLYDPGEALEGIVYVYEIDEWRYGDDADFACTLAGCDP